MALRQRGASGAIHAATPTIRAFALPVLAAAVFCASYLTWRPLDVLFTLSDGLFCLAALLLVAGGSLSARPFGAFTAFWLAAFATMVVGLLIGSVVNGDPLRWAIGSAQYFFGLVVLPFLIIGRDRASTIVLAQALIAGVACMEVFGIGIYYFYGTGFHDYQKLGLEFISGSHRLGAFLSDANWNGAVIAMTMPFVLYLYRLGVLGGVLTGAVLTVLLWAGVLAASVSALACAIAGVVTMVIAGGIKVPLKAVAAVVAGIAVWFLSGNALPAAFSSRVLPALESGDLSDAGTFTGRVELMREAWMIVEHTMIVGLGVDQFRVVSLTGAPVHNMYLLLWAEGGMLALLGWIGLMLVLLSASVLALRRNRLTGALGLALTANFLISSTASPHMYARLWLVPVFLAMAFVFERPGRSAHLGTRGVR